jgi:hypothetical protein
LDVYQELLLLGEYFIKVIIRNTNKTMGFILKIYVGFGPKDWKQFDQFKSERKGQDFIYNGPLEWVGDPEEIPDVADLTRYSKGLDDDLRFYNCPVVQVVDDGKFMVQYARSSSTDWETVDLLPYKLKAFEGLFERHSIEGKIQILWGGC